MSKIGVRVNNELLERVRKAREIELLQDRREWAYDTEELEKFDLSDLYEKLFGMDEKYLAVAVTVAIDKHPIMVLQVLAEYVNEINKKRGKTNDGKD